MERLLSWAKSGVLPGRNLSDAVVMLPLSLTDNPKTQLRLLKTRRNKVLAIARRDLEQEKAKARTAIDEALSEIKAHTPS